VTRFSDILIIGGGLHGLSAALYLAQAGLQVRLVEKDHIGRHASSVNAGGVRQLGRALPEIPLAAAANTIWQNIEDLVGDNCCFRRVGQIKVAETSEDLAALETRRKSIAALGFNHEEMIGDDELYHLLPALKPDCVGGMVVRTDGHANPFQTVQAFRQKSLALGVKMSEDCPVTAISRSGNIWQVTTAKGEFGAPVVINCAGAWGGEIAQILGDNIPLRATALMLMITERLAPFIKPVVGSQARPLSFKQFDNGTVLIGGAYQGTAYPARNKTSLDFAGLAKNAASAAILFPAMKNAQVLRCWAGIEGHTPDEMPVIGAGSAKGIFHCFGFSAHGFALAPIGGQIIRDLVISGKSTLPISAFSPHRFSGWSHPKM